MEKTRIALVDDHPLFRQGLRVLLESEPDLCVVGEADDARNAYLLIESQRPDLIVLDMTLPGVDGVAATREMRRRVPGCRVLILTMHEDQQMAARALAAGAAGYAVKTERSEAVLEAVRVVSRGGRYLTAQLTGPMHHDADAEPLDPLSPREREVFHLLVRGFSNQGVAKELGISIKTVETHRTHIHHKLGVHSVTELIRFAARNRLLPI